MMATDERRIHAVGKLLESEGEDFRLKHPELLDAYHAASERGQWVSADERLPEDAKDVLILSAFRSQSGLVDSCCCVGWLDGDGNWYEQHSHQQVAGEITHWMPLPAPPAEKGEGR